MSDTLSKGECLVLGLGLGATLAGALSGTQGLVVGLVVLLKLAYRRTEELKLRLDLMYETHWALRRELYHDYLSKRELVAVAEFTSVPSAPPAPPSQPALRALRSRAVRT